MWVVDMYLCDIVGRRTLIVFLFKQKTAYDMRISDGSSDVCSSDLTPSDPAAGAPPRPALRAARQFGGSDGGSTGPAFVRRRRPRHRGRRRSEERRGGKACVSTCRYRW